MLGLPVVPDNPAQLQQFLREYLSEIAHILQAIGDGKTYPHGAILPKNQYWDDIVASFNAGRAVGANTPTWATLRDGLKAWEFSATAMNEIWLSPLHLDHTATRNTPLYLHIHWTTGGTNTGVVRWGIEYSIAKGHNQEAFPATTTVYLEQAASGTAYKHMIVEVPDVSAVTASVEPDSLLLARVFRDGGHANDTCTDTAFGLMMDVHYVKSWWATKNKSPDFYG